MDSYTKNILFFSDSAEPSHTFTRVLFNCAYNDSQYICAMSLEKEIQQEKFGNEYEKAAVNILYTGSWLHNLNASRLKQHGLTPEQYNVLRILRGSHPKTLRLSDISCRMIDKNSNATRLVEKLRIKGLLKRERCENNRRQVDVFITEKGLAALRKIDQEEALWLLQLKNINKAEAVELNRILDKLRSS
jgi:DNA-binding MarR family transcriptional regulator